MNSLIKSISEFISNLVAAALIGGTITLFAGEVRLAALKKASHGSSRLSGFTARMTKMNTSQLYGGQRGAGKTSH